MCIHFSHPTKKRSLCEALHGRQPRPELKLPWAGHGELVGGEGEGGEGRGGRGALLGR
jgi:hypothetical protein